VPSVVRHKTIPSVYSPEEIEQLLASVNRDDESGKRDYAIILIAARLGLRASDIAALTFDCLRLEKGTVEIVQKKTNTPHIVPLTDEVKTAIFDYVDNARPKSDERRIFLNLRGYGTPMPASIGGIVHKAFIRSGVDCKDRRSCSHALRASLATALLAEGNDYYTVQSALG
jgi:integrase